MKMQNSWIILAIATLSIVFDTAQCGVLVNEASEQESACSSAAEVADYLVPDPNNCKKYFSCQRLGPGRGWEAIHMDCGTGTAFDPESKICNLVDEVQACKAAPPPTTAAATTAAATTAAATTAGTTAAATTTAIPEREPNCGYVGNLLLPCWACDCEFSLQGHY